MATFASIQLKEKVDEDDDEEPTTSTEQPDQVLGIKKTGPKKLQTGEVSSLFNLKNQLLKKQNNLKKTNLSDPYVSGKSSVLVTKKDEKEAMEKEAEARRKRMEKNERGWRAEEETRRIQEAHERLKEKAELYEKLAHKGSLNSIGDGDFAHFPCQGQIVMENPDNTPMEFMVDFNTKKRKKEEDEDIEKNYPSTSGRAPIPERYHHSEEQRVYGVSHMRFSANEEKRKEEIQNLLDMSKETKLESKRMKVEEDAKEAKRREKINALRKLKGLEPLKEPSPPPEVDLDEIPIPEPHETAEQKHIRLMKSNREWDRGKGLYTQWIEKQRDERDDEFRPPDSYFK